MEQRRTNWTVVALAVMSAGLAVGPIAAQESPGGFGDFLAKKNSALSPEAQRIFSETVRKTAAMVGDDRAQQYVDKYKLDLLNLTWEDTGRFKNSAVGPNISDMTIQVQIPAGSGRTESVLMPVIRHPNFSDKTGEMDPRDFTLLVGNEHGRSLKRVSLYEFLQSPDRFLTHPRSWTAQYKTLLAPRDEKVLVSAQACFLPVPQSGKATFNPVLFNYQSSPGNPAVLTILATREGTSTTIIDNKRNVEQSWSWGQPLFHNANGQRTPLTGERFSDWDREGRPGQGQGDARVSDEALNMVLLIQVPLKHRDERRSYEGGGGGFGGADMVKSPAMAKGKKAEQSDVENAVIGHGDEEGPFSEMDGLPVERDARYPVRVTVQFYKATSNGVMSEQDARQIKHDIDRVYAASTSVGSLVTGGETGRITEYDGPKVQPSDWWKTFWANYETWSGVSRDEARERLSRLLGSDYAEKPVTELYLRDLLRNKRK